MQSVICTCISFTYGPTYGPTNLINTPQVRIVIDEVLVGQLNTVVRQSAHRAPHESLIEHYGLLAKASDTLTHTRTIPIPIPTPTPTPIPIHVPSPYHPHAHHTPGEPAARPRRRRCATYQPRGTVGARAPPPQAEHMHRQLGRRRLSGAVAWHRPWGPTWREYHGRLSIVRCSP